jgi:hypothetical protein
MSSANVRRSITSDSGANKVARVVECDIFRTASATVGSTSANASLGILSPNVASLGVIGTDVDVSFSGTTTSVVDITGGVAALSVNGMQVVTNQQTTSGAAPGGFVANTSGIADDTATFTGGAGVGYTIGEIVAALKAHGLIAT